ncbi:sepiapterin reductase [bacterium BMS3Abin01]|nr:sepiapterin reductase [bacterium BMS3Abin01]
MDTSGSRTVLITGCRRGIGRDAAVTLARRGHRVIATTHTGAAAESLARTAAAESLPIEAFRLDVTDGDDRRRILDRDIDVLINNAAVGESGSLAEIDIDRVRRSFETNLFGPLELTQLVLRKMIERDAGTVVFISSLAGRITMPFMAPYTMTKFAISGGAETLRNELHRISDGVQITVVEPGAYHTGFNQEMVATKYEWMDGNSYFHGILEKIRAGEERYFRRMEKGSTASIVRQIVRAAEAERPRLRYAAPWWQALGVRLMRMAGR